MGNSTTTTQRADPWKPAQPMLEQGLQDAKGLYQSGGFNIDPYGGSLVAGYDPMRAQADAMTPGAVGAGLGGVGMGQAALTRAMDPAMRSGAWGQVRQNTIDSIMPAINQTFAGAGMTGSDLHQQNLARGLSAGLGEVENNAWQQGEQRALQAAGMVPGMNAAGFGALDWLRQSGQGRQEQAQSEINANVLQDQQRKTAALNAIQDYMSLVGGTGSMFGTNTARAQQNMGLGGILGFGIQALPAIAAMSDRRLKEDIKKVGKTDDGLNVYTYRYKGDPKVQMGVMAQEVEKKKPEAVTTINGFKAVYYGAL